MEQDNQSQPRPPVDTENQPRPAETDGGSGDQRRRRPRRRYPRRRFYDRGPRNENSNSSFSENSRSEGGPYEQNGPAGEGSSDPEAQGNEALTSEQAQAEPEFGEGIIEISGKGF